MSDLGLSTKSLTRYVPEASIYQTSYWDGNAVQGSFPVIRDEGYIIYQQEAGCLIFTGPLKNGEVPLYAGKNLIGIPLMSSAETLFDVFRDFRQKRGTLSSVHYYRSQGGGWIGTYDFFGKISGPCPNIKKGLGCLVYVW